MKKRIADWLLPVMLAAIPAVLSAQKTERYISPNNDGVQDALVIPVKITDRRLITSWQLVIEDEGGSVVRTIGNKVALPAKVSFKSFFKQLATPKTGVDVPASVTWNGAMDNGETAPDGKYFYYFTATDDNGNKGITEKYPVVVDTKAPEIALSQPADKVFGEGAKSSLRIRQSGSVEDSWVGSFKNTAGEVVRTMRWSDSAPEAFSWNGTDDGGRTVPDGVYSYEVSAADRAGNVSAPASITNIIYSAEKPAVNILIYGSQYFSPGTDSPLSSLRLLVKIPAPSPASGNRLTSWSVAIVGKDGKAYRTYNQEQSENPPDEIVFDGTDGKGARIPQGVYQAVVSASYLNGYTAPIVKSPEIILDVTKPSAKLGVSEKIFGAGAKDSVKISIQIDDSKKIAPVQEWKGRIFDTANPEASVREYSFGQFPPEFVVWNGFDAAGRLVPDAKYRFEISAVDLAGNAGAAVSAEEFELNTKAATVLLAMDSSAFSPNGDGVKDAVSFTPVLKDSAGISGYSFHILDASGAEVAVQSGAAALPPVFVWNGKNADGSPCADGTYTARLDVNSLNGSSASVSTQPFVLDTKPPVLNAEAAWSAFSPDGDGNQDVLPVGISGCSQEELWTAEVRNSSGKAVRKYTWNGTIKTGGKDEFAWDGAGEAGNKAPDGTYSIVISSQDAAGNSFQTVVPNIVLDSRETKAYITVENEGISPNADNVLDTQNFAIRTGVQDGILSWNFDIRSESGASVRKWSGGKGSAVPESIIWDGMDAAGKPCEGTFTGALQIVYQKGNRAGAVSSPFISTVTRPQLSVKIAPEFFSPDNDGVDDDLFIRLTGSSKAPIKSWSFVIYDPNGKPFWRTSGTSSITEQIVWDGLSNLQKNAAGKAERVQSAMDYPYVFEVSDSVGMSSEKKGAIPIDVLVIRDGSVLKMAVPAIIFRSDHADFKTAAEVGKGGLDADKAANNERVLKRIADILNKFKDYKVTIVGHANRVTDNEAEETEDNPRIWGPALIPLSGARAEFVKEYLVKSGVGAARLSTEGKGGTELVVDYKDKDNNWKNRRVEFILNK